MDKDRLKKALLCGIPGGLVVALALIGGRTLISGNGFVENLSSLYGILTLICFPIGGVALFYSNQKKK